MRCYALVLTSLAAVIVAVLGCGGTTKDPVATAGSDPSRAGATESGRGVGGEVPDAGGSAGEPSAVGSVAGSGGPGPELVDCDPRKIVCKRVAPTCGTFEVPSVDGACYGECVKIERCACSGPEQCPDPNQFTCWSKTHCGPFVN